jgi:hypothetical protein
VVEGGRDRGTCEEGGDDASTAVALTISERTATLREKFSESPENVTRTDHGDGDTIARQKDG